MKQFLTKAATFSVLGMAIAATAMPAFAQQSYSPVAKSPVQARGYDCAHGPDTYRVRNVANWDVLNMRSGPSSRTQIVGQISPSGSGVHCLGPCRGNWCRVSWRGAIGWVNMRFLGE